MAGARAGRSRGDIHLSPEKPCRAGQAVPCRARASVHGPAGPAGAAEGPGPRSRGGLWGLPRRRQEQDKTRADGDSCLAWCLRVYPPGDKTRADGSACARGRRGNLWPSSSLAGRAGQAMARRVPPARQGPASGGRRVRTEETATAQTAARGRKRHSGEGGEREKSSHPAPPPHTPPTPPPPHSHRGDVGEGPLHGLQRLVPQRRLLHQAARLPVRPVSNDKGIFSWSRASFTSLPACPCTPPPPTQAASGRRESFLGPYMNS